MDPGNTFTQTALYTVLSALMRMSKRECGVYSSEAHSHWHALKASLANGRHGIQYWPVAGYNNINVCHTRSVCR